MALLYSFPPELIMLPAASTNFPQYLNVMAGGAYRSALAFSNSVSEKSRSISFEMPAFTGTLTAKVKFAIAATSGNVRFRIQIEARTPLDSGNTNTTTSYDTANSSASTAVPATTYVEAELSITLTNNNGVVAGDRVTFTIDRDVSVGSNAAGDCFVYLVSLSDAS